MRRVTVIVTALPKVVGFLQVLRFPFLPLEMLTVLVEDQDRYSANPQLIEYCTWLGNSLELIIYVGAKFMQEGGPFSSRVYCIFAKL